MKTRNLLPLICIAASALLLSVSCDKEGGTPEQRPSDPVAWTPDSQSIEIIQGACDFVHGTATCRDNSKTSADATTVQSSDETTVAADGKLIAGVKPGTATVKAFMV